MFRELNVLLGFRNLGGTLCFEATLTNPFCFNIPRPFLVPSTFLIPLGLFNPLAPPPPTPRTWSCHPLRVHTPRRHDITTSLSSISVTPGLTWTVVSDHASLNIISRTRETERDDGRIYVETGERQTEKRKARTRQSKAHYIDYEMIPLQNVGLQRKAPFTMLWMSVTLSPECYGIYASESNYKKSKWACFWLRFLKWTMAFLVESWTMSGN